MYETVHLEERLVIEKIFGDRIGRLLEIGAYDGTTASLSSRLIDNGWSAVLVEPAARAFSRLLNKYAGMTRIELIHCAVSPTPGLVKFYETRGSAHDQLSSLNRNFATAWDVSGDAYWVKSIGVKELFCAVGSPDFDLVIIDAEGLSVEIAKAMPFASMLKTNVICVESDDGSCSDAAAAISQWYNVTIIHPNAIGVRKNDYDAEESKVQEEPLLINH